MVPNMQVPKRLTLWAEPTLLPTADSATVVVGGGDAPEGGEYALLAVELPGVTVTTHLDGQQLGGLIAALVDIQDALSDAPAARKCADGATEGAQPSAPVVYTPGDRVHFLVPPAYTEIATATVTAFDTVSRTVETVDSDGKSWTFSVDDDGLGPSTKTVFVDHDSLVRYIRNLPGTNR